MMLRYAPWIAVAALGGLALYQRAQINAERLEWANERHGAAVAALRSIERAQGETIRMQEKANEALRTAAQTRRTNAVASAAAGAELDGLRNDLAAARAALPTVSVEACRARVAALETVFEQCAERYTGMARKAEGHAADAVMLENAWPSDQCE